MLPILSQYTHLLQRHITLLLFHYRFKALFTILFPSFILLSIASLKPDRPAVRSIPVPLPNVTMEELRVPFEVGLPKTGEVVLFFAPESKIAVGIMQRLASLNNLTYGTDIRPSPTGTASVRDIMDPNNEKSLRSKTWWTLVLFSFSYSYQPPYNKTDIVYTIHEITSHPHNARFLLSTQTAIDAASLSYAYDPASNADLSLHRFNFTVNKLKGTEGHAADNFTNIKLQQDTPNVIAPAPKLFSESRSGDGVQFYGFPLLSISYFPIIALCYSIVTIDKSSGHLFILKSHGLHDSAYYLSLYTSLSILSLITSFLISITAKLPWPYLFLKLVSFEVFFFINFIYALTISAFALVVSTIRMRKWMPGVVLVVYLGFAFIVGATAFAVDGSYDSDPSWSFTGAWVYFTLNLTQKIPLLLLLPCFHYLKLLHHIHILTSPNLFNGFSPTPYTFTTFISPSPFTLFNKRIDYAVELYGKVETGGVTAAWMLASVGVFLGCTLGCGQLVRAERVRNGWRWWARGWSDNGGKRGGEDGKVKCVNVRGGSKGEKVKGVTLELEEGKVHVVLGEKGSGAASLVKFISLQSTPKSGHIHLHLHNPLRAPLLASSLIRRCYNTLHPFILPTMNSSILNAFTRTDGAWDPHLGGVDAAMKSVGTGRIAVFRKPGRGISEERRLKVWGMIRDPLLREGRVVVVETDSIAEAEAVGDIVHVMHQGRLVNSSALPLPATSSVITLSTTNPGSIFGRSLKSLTLDSMPVRKSWWMKQWWWKKKIRENVIAESVAGEVLRDWVNGMGGFLWVEEDNRERKVKMCGVDVEGVLEMVRICGDVKWKVTKGGLEEAYQILTNPPRAPTTPFLPFNAYLLTLPIHTQLTVQGAALPRKTHYEASTPLPPLTEFRQKSRWRGAQQVGAVVALRMRIWGNGWRGCLGNVFLMASTAAIVFFIIALLGFGYRRDFEVLDSGNAWRDYAVKTESRYLPQTIRTRYIITTDYTSQTRPQLANDVPTPHRVVFRGNATSTWNGTLFEKGAEGFSDVQRALEGRRVELKGCEGFGRRGVLVGSEEEVVSVLRRAYPEYEVEVGEWRMDEGGVGVSVGIGVYGKGFNEPALAAVYYAPNNSLSPFYPCTAFVPYGVDVFPTIGVSATFQKVTNLLLEKRAQQFQGYNGTTVRVTKMPSFVFEGFDEKLEYSAAFERSSRIILFLAFTLLPIPSLLSHFTNDHIFSRPHLLTLYTLPLALYHLSTFVSLLIPITIFSIPVALIFPHFIDKLCVWGPIVAIWCMGVSASRRKTGVFWVGRVAMALGVVAVPLFVMTAEKGGRFGLGLFWNPVIAMGSWLNVGELGMNRTDLAASVGILGATTLMCLVYGVYVTAVRGYAITQPRDIENTSNEAVLITELNGTTLPEPVSVRKGEVFGFVNASSDLFECIAAGRGVHIKRSIGYAKKGWMWSRVSVDACIKTLCILHDLDVRTVLNDFRRWVSARDGKETLENLDTGLRTRVEVFAAGLGAEVVVLECAEGCWQMVEEMRGKGMTVLVGIEKDLGVCERVGVLRDFGWEVLDVGERRRVVEENVKLSFDFHGDSDQIVVTNELLATLFERLNATSLLTSVSGVEVLNVRQDEKGLTRVRCWVPRSVAVSVESIGKVLDGMGALRWEVGEGSVL